MKTILLGGLDPDTREQVCQAFLPLQDDYEIGVVASAPALASHLQAPQGDLLILDLNAQEGDSLTWLAVIAELRSCIPVLAIGLDRIPDVQGYDLKYPDRYFPFVKYLQKPVTGTALLEAAILELNQATWGVIQGLSLPSLLQMLSMERKTCTIRVSSGRRQGFFYLQDGQLINARYRRQEGLEAALRLIESRSPKAEIDGQLHDSLKLIDRRIDEILMEAAQFQDEVTHDHGYGPDGELDEIPASELDKWDRRPQPADPTSSPHTDPLKRSARPARPGPGRWLGLSAGVVLALASAGGWLWPRTLQVDIQSTPPGALVSLNGTARGRTPLKLALPKPLQGTLQLTQAGHEPFQHQLQPEERTLVFALQPLAVAATALQRAIAPVVPALARQSVPARAAKPIKSVKPGKIQPGAAGASKRDIFDALRKSTD